MAGRRVFRFEDVEVDPGQGCLRRQGKEEYPRTKVLQVLLYLLEHRDRLVTKEELIQHVWKNTAVTDDVLFHCISDIRILLDEDLPRGRFVRTFPGCGYRFVAPVEEAWLEYRDEPLAPPSRVRRVRRRLWVAALFPVIVPAIWMGISRTWQNVEPSRAEVAWWRFDEGGGMRVKDSSGHGNGGVLVDGPVWTDGQLGKALRFDGVRSHVAGTHAGHFFPRGSAARTVSAWIRTASTNGDFTSIFHYGTSGAPYNRFFHLGLCDDGRIAAGYPIGEALVRGTSRVDDNSWHFATGVYEGAGTNVMRVFVDGLQETETRLRPPPETGAGSVWRIGRGMESGTPFRGLIDDIRIYSRALRAAEVMALYRCRSRQADLTAGGERQYYYLPVFASGAEVVIGPAGTLRRQDNGIVGVQFAQSDGLCSMQSLRGADMGQDLYIGVDLLMAANSAGNVTTAGPYFRSRAAAPGDGVIGGTSAGYWVQLYSTGVVKVRCLKPHQIVGFTAAPSGFDPNRFHRLEVTAKGAELCVRLDDRPQVFDQGGRQVHIVSIPSAWEGPPRVGVNRGTAGIAFSSEPPNFRGSQQARNIVVQRK